MRPYAPKYPNWLENPPATHIGQSLNLGDRVKIVTLCVHFIIRFYLQKPSYVTGRLCHGFRRLVACLSPLGPGSRPCEIFGEESDIGTDISPRSSVSPFQYHSTVTLHTHIIWWMNNMPVRGRSSEIQSHPIDMNINIRMLLDKRFI
jgi:hypothetical protein